MSERAKASWILPGVLPVFAAASPAASVRGPVYVPRGRRTRVKAYVFQPAAPGTNRRAVLLFHGGKARRIGEPAWVFQRAESSAANGIVAIAVIAEQRRPVPADAVEGALAAFGGRVQERREYGIDTKRVGGYGVLPRANIWWPRRRRSLPSRAEWAQTAAERPDGAVLVSPPSTWHVTIFRRIS